MNLLLRPTFWIFVLFIIPFKSVSQKIYGGHFDRRTPVGALNNVDFAYRFACTFYTDAAGAAALPQQLNFRIIRKKDNVVVKQYLATKEQDTQSNAVQNDCVAAGAASKLDYYFVRYNYDMVVTPTEYNDVDGYYVVNDPVGNRNPTVNVQSSNVVLYHWFSPQYLFDKPDNPNDGKLFSGWVPQSYSFVCKSLGTLTLGVAANPAQTLVNGQTFNLTLKSAIPLTDGALPFKEVAWKSGYSNSNVGMGAISIVNAVPTWSNNVNTSSISINTPGPTLGVFSVAFITEHRRNGVKIAENYRELQIEVTDCIKTIMSSGLTLSEVGNKATLVSATVCNGKQVQLNTEGGFPQNDIYQWYKNNQIIAGANKSELVVSESGAYYATMKKNGACNTVTSNVLNPLFVDCQNNGGAVSILGNSLNSPFTSSGGSTFIQAWYNYFSFRSDYYIPTADLPKMPASLKASLYRKRDNLKIDELVLTRSAASEYKIYLPKICGNGFDTLQSVGYVNSQFEITAAKYGATSGGYYVVTEPLCCRANNDNLAATNTKVVNYAELNGADQVEWNGVSGKSHLLNISAPARIDACAGQTVTINFGVGNQQNLSARLAGFVDVITDATTAQPFTNIGWKSGFGINNFVGNTTPLQITQNGNTFTLSGTPEKPGTYTYRVKFEGLMNGQVYSTVFSEFRLVVKDCKTPTKPTIFVSKVGQPNVAAKASVCQDSSVQLNLRNFSKGSKFQWQVSGGNLAQATDSIMIVTNSQSGLYGCIVRNALLCPETMTADPVSISFLAKPTAVFTVTDPSGANCGNTPSTLTATTSGIAPIVYQWYKDNAAISGATSSSYDATNAGNYAIKITDANGCSNLSAAQNVVPKTPPTAEITAAIKALCQGQSVSLTANTGTGYVYSWSQNGQNVAGSSNVLVVSQAGSYTVKVTATNGCATTSKAFIVIQANNPTVTISGGNQLCQGANITLTANSANIKTYQWQLDGQSMTGETKNTLTTSKTGRYTVVVADTNGCTATSTPNTVAMVTKITVLLDSIPNFCGTAYSPINLNGTPSGGVFSGDGVVGSTFDPKSAGVGQHTVNYTINGNLPCLTGQAQRTVTITAAPLLNLGADREVFRGSTVLLSGDLGVGYSYVWTPSTWLENPYLAKTNATPEKSITYILKASGPDNCVATDTIHISVIQGIYIPDVFTPNGDFINDTWELKGIEEYPEAEVFIYDRWGNVVFVQKGSNQKAFDGTFNGTELTTGVYAFLIKTSPTGRNIRGQLLLSR